MQGRPNGCTLSRSLVLLLVSLTIACMSAAAQTPAAPPAASGAPDAGLLSAPEASPKRGGVLRWGGLANSTLYDLHQTGTIANMGPQAPIYDLLVQIDPLNWRRILPDLAQSWQVSEDGTWALRALAGLHAQLHGPSIGCMVVLADVYDRIVFPAKEEP